MGPLASMGIDLARDATSGLIGGLINRWNWNTQNKYNHPKEAMKRFEEAGLNPNLIYGSGGSGAAGNAAPIQPAKASNLTDYQDYRIKQGQLRQIELQNEGLKQENRLKANQADKSDQVAAIGLSNSLGNYLGTDLPSNVIGQGVLNYQREYIEELLMKANTRATSQLNRVLEAEYGADRRDYTIKKIQADIANTLERTGQVKDARSAYRGLKAFTDSVGAQTDVARAILEVTKYLLTAKR